MYVYILCPKPEDHFVPSALGSSVVEDKDN